MAIEEYQIDPKSLKVSPDRRTLHVTVSRGFSKSARTIPVRVEDMLRRNPASPTQAKAGGR